MSLGYDADAVADATQVAQEINKSQDELASDFQATFNGSPQSDSVLVFLANYCHQVKSCYVAGDPSASTFLEGRRDVMLRILSYLQMDDREMLERARERARRTR